MSIGFRICKRHRVVEQSFIDRFKALPVANVSDNMWRMSAGGARLRPMHGSGHMAGPALTVKTRPGDNLMIHKALNMAQAGDVVVVDGGGELTNALIGELMLSFAIKTGVAGIVIDGAVRDAECFPRRGLPVYAAGVTHRGPYKDGPGEINVPIAIDGMVIEPGDLMLGDDDGILCVPYDHVETVCVASEAKLRAEEQQMAEIESGTSDRSWVEESLTRLGCEIE
ncbi:MAG: RraA family protein [Pseudomonadota bacterium]